MSCEATVELVIEPDPVEHSVVGVVRCELGPGHRVIPGPRTHRATLYGTRDDESVPVTLTWTTAR